MSTSTLGAYCVTPSTARYSLSLASSGTSSAQPQLNLEPVHAPKKIQSLNQWLTAFHTFVAIYVERYPLEAPQLMKYCEVVRDIASKPGKWLFYDEQFRYIRQSAPVSYPWDTVHWELLQRLKFTMLLSYFILAFPFMKH